MSARRWARLCALSFLSGRAPAPSTGAALTASALGRVSGVRLSVVAGPALPRGLCCRAGELLRKQAVQTHLQRLLEEHRVICRDLQSGAGSDADRRGLHRRLVELSPVVKTFESCEAALTELSEVEAHLHSKSLHTTGTQERAALLYQQAAARGTTEDIQMVELLREEQQEIEKRIKELNRKLVQKLVPIDEHDSSNVILEVSAGRTTGGDICQQFTQEVFDMYQRFSSYKDWDFEVFNYSKVDYGGLHHAAVRITGENVYGWLKFEGGTHRVQRIPEVGLSSRMQRIHTGTMTVIVLPQPEDVDIDIDPKDLRIDTFRSRGAGGQSVNTTDSAVRIVHLPTGTVTECQQTRSQLQNRETAMRMLKAQLFKSSMGRQVEERHTSRKQQMGSRSQSERIRTYNFSQDRVTDHRIGYVTRDIKEFMSGGEMLEELLLQLQEHADEEALLELVKNTTGRADEL